MLSRGDWATITVLIFVRCAIYELFLELWGGGDKAWTLELTRLFPHPAWPSMLASSVSDLVSCKGNDGIQNQGIKWIVLGGFRGPHESLHFEVQNRLRIYIRKNFRQTSSGNFEKAGERFGVKRFALQPCSMHGRWGWPRAACFEDSIPVARFSQLKRKIEFISIQDVDSTWGIGQLSYTGRTNHSHDQKLAIDMPNHSHAKKMRLVLHVPLATGLWSTFVSRMTLGSQGDATDESSSYYASPWHESIIMHYVWPHNLSGNSQQCLGSSIPTTALGGNSLHVDISNRW